MPISSEVSLLSAVLQQLGSSLENDEYVKLCRVETLATTKAIAEECNKAFKELDSIISKYIESGRLSVVDRMKWPYVEKKVELVRVNLDRFKTTLILMLEVLKYARSIVKHDRARVDSGRELILTLQKANIDATRRYENLLRAIEPSSSGAEKIASSSGIPQLSSVPDKHPAYVLVDEQGLELASRSCLFKNKELMLKIEKISNLIDEVEIIQEVIRKATNPTGILEMAIEPNHSNENRHFRHTSVSKLLDLPSSGNSSSEMRSIDARNVYIALIGMYGVGKTSFVNSCCGANTARIGQGLESCTSEVETYQFMYSPSIRVTLFDTPGFDDTRRSDHDVLRDIASFLSHTYKQQVLLTGILYFHRITDPRIFSSGIRLLRMFRKLCGTTNLKSTILVTTCWDQVTEEEGARREINLSSGPWADMMQRGSRIMRVTGSKGSAFRVVRSIVELETDVVLDIQSEMVDQGLSLTETGAGKAVNELLSEFTTLSVGDFLLN